MEDTELVTSRRPQLGQHVGIKVRAIRDHDVGFQSPDLEALQEAAHVVSVITANQSEADGQRQIIVLKDINDLILQAGEHPGMVVMKSLIGGKRVDTLLAGE
jgi:hypothetical protein